MLNTPPTRSEIATKIDIIIDDVYDTFYRDEEEEAKVAKEGEDMNLSIMKEKFLAMVKAEMARDDKGKEKLVEDNRKGKEAKHHHLKVNKDDKGKGKLVEDNGNGKVDDDDDLDSLDLENRIKKLEEDFGWLLKAKKAKESKKAKEAKKARDAKLAKQAKKVSEAELKANEAKKANEAELKANKAKEAKDAMLAKLKAKKAKMAKNAKKSMLAEVV
nr:hypothetical protein [Tanacetum cinerariifolium]